jgi:tetrapyrrole methylase family protein/MazG family protein/ATP diphosphatase
MREFEVSMADQHPSSPPMVLRDLARAEDLEAPAIERLLSVMARLRNPDGGCPWDLEQDFATIAPYTIEEAYEVADAIQRGDLQDLREELGDLLFQVVFHSQMAEEQGAFRFEDVAAGMADKMIQRHPHVFGDADERDAESQTRAWEAQKAEERAEKLKDDPSVLANVPLALPALTRAEKLMKRAARVGFDWPTIGGVFAKIDEELAEAREAVDEGDPAHIAEEIGDLLSTVVNLARKLEVDPEAALRASNAKFERRFRAIEQKLAERNSSVEEADLDAMEALWLEAKMEERS